MGGRILLLAATRYVSPSFNTTSVIYEYFGGSSPLTQVTTFASNAAVDARWFQSGGDTFVLVAFAGQTNVGTSPNVQK